MEHIVATNYDHVVQSGRCHNCRCFVSALYATNYVHIKLIKTVGKLPLFKLCTIAQQCHTRKH